MPSSAPRGPSRWCEALVALAALIGTSRGTGAAESTSERFTVLVANLAIDVGAKLTRLEAASAAMDASQPWVRARGAHEGVAPSVLDRSLSAALTCGQNVHLPLEAEPRRALAAALWSTQCVRPSAGQQSGDCRESNQGIATTWGSLTAKHARHKWSALAALHRLSEPKGFDILQSPQSREDDPSERSVGPLLEALSLNEPRDVLLPVLVCLRAVLPLHVLSKREDGADAANRAFERVLGPVEAALKTDRRCRQRRVVSALVACVYQPALLGEPIVMSPLQRFFDVLVECGRARRPHILRALVARVVNGGPDARRPETVCRDGLPGSRPCSCTASRSSARSSAPGTRETAKKKTKTEANSRTMMAAARSQSAAPGRAPAPPCLPGAVVRVTLLLFLESLPTCAADATSVETFAVSRGKRAPRENSSTPASSLPFTHATCRVADLAFALIRHFFELDATDEFQRPAIVGTYAFTRRLRAWQALCVLQRFIYPLEQAGDDAPFAQLLDIICTSLWRALKALALPAIRHFVEAFAVAMCRRFPQRLVPLLFAELGSSDAQMSQVLGSLLTVTALVAVPDEVPDDDAAGGARRPGVVSAACERPRSASC